jgi:hypothetical protein
MSCILVLFKVNVQLPSQPQTAAEKLKRVDFFGSITLVVGIGSLLLGVSLKTSEELPWSSPIVWSFLAASGIFLTGFVLVEKHVAIEPILPMRLLKSRTTLSVAVANL